MISPQTPDTFWSFKHVLRFVSKRAAFPPLGLLTVAAMLPRTWDLRVVDLNVRRLKDKDLLWADYVMISAMIVQKESVHEVAGRCQALKKPLIAGGPLFTTGHQEFPEIPHFVLGEVEVLIAELIRDMEAGQLRSIYHTDDHPALSHTPIPRWDLIHLPHYVAMAAQYSRGCPFDCEFCDIIVMNGRTPRTKSPEQLVAELELLRQMDWQDMVFIVDDNFIGNRRHTRDLLEAIIDWRTQTGSNMGFLTEVSINLVDDPDLFKLMVKAGFKKIFIGIESPSAEALEECHKQQNKNRDMVAAVRSLQEAGLQVMGGFIVGFDSDAPDIFHRQYEFIQRSGVVTAMVGLLTALPKTRLYHRLFLEGRILEGTTGNNTEATLNFTPRLNREYLINGYRQLMKSLYEPRNYYRRVRTCLDHYRPTGPRLKVSWSDIFAFMKSFWFLGVWHSGRFAYWRLCLGTIIRRPRSLRYAIELAIEGHHFRKVARRL